MFTSPASIALAAFFAFSGVLISIYQILCHLRNYTEPVFQRYIIRIIFMVPVYAIGSFCSLQWREGAIYFDTIRDCYEAWIIYNFSSLLLAYVGGPGAVVVKAEGKQVHPSWAHMTCCLPTMQVDGFFLRRCKQGTLQFVLMKPIMATLTVILYAAGAYTDGDMSPSNGYFYISILYNVCYTFALYGLLLFWIGATELLQPFNPLLKFILVKTVVFLTFWQGIAISYVNSMGEISDPEDGKALQNFMICVEMALAGVSLLFAFPHKEYQIGGSTAGFRADAFIHAISIKDVMRDTIHVFAPSYSDYVLYSDGGPADNVKRKKYRGQKGNAGGEHPKSGLIKNMEKGVLQDDDDDESGAAGGRRSKTPLGSSSKKLEAHRNQAILLDSDSDGIDSEDEGAQVGTEIAASDDFDGGSGSDDGGSLSRPNRIPANRISSAMGDEDGDGSGSNAGSRRVTRQRSSRKNNNNSVNNSRPSETTAPAGGERGAGGTRGHTRTGSYSLPPPLPAASKIAAAGEAAVSAPAPMRMPMRGAILSDSDDSDDEGSVGGEGDGEDVQGEPEPHQTEAAGKHDGSSSSSAEEHKKRQREANGSNAGAAEAAQQAAAPVSPVAAGQGQSAARSAVQRATAGAAAAAGRVLAAVQGSAAAVLPQAPPAAATAAAAARGASPVLHALAPPRRAAGSVAVAAAAAWEPAFPGQQVAEGEQQRGRSQNGAVDGPWAEQGWSNVKL